VCHSPERVSSGRVFRDLRTYPKLVGGVDAASAARAVALYESILDFDERPDLPRPNGVWDLGSAEAAELAKLAETTYRDVNIAFANELAVIAEDRGLDVWKVIEACNSQPFSHIHQPGISVGGHCIPVYPHFLLAGAPHARLPAVAREVNQAMPPRCVDRLREHLGGDLGGRRVLVLGVAYRPGVKESAFSGAFALVSALEGAGASVRVHDPLFDDDELHALGLHAHAPGEHADAVVLHTAHDTYTSDFIARVAPEAEVVLDGRNLLDLGEGAPFALARLGVGDPGARGPAAPST
jgi:nucleotide sugar dehydrogenase